MTISVTAKSQTISSFNFTETIAGSVNVDNSILNSLCDYTHGTGDFQITAGILQTGVLPSGGSINIDLTSMPKEFLDYTSTVGFSGIKTLCISNTSTVKGRDIAVRATGVNPFSTIFNGGSGNLLVKPYSSYLYNNPYGDRTSPTLKNIQLFDVSGSGATYNISVLGDLT